MLNSATLLLVLVVFTTVTTLMLVAAALPSDALSEQRQWAAGNVAASLGFAVGALTELPALVHAGLSYALLGLGLAVVLRGLRQFCGQSLRWPVVLAITVGSFVVPAYFAVVQPDKAARLAVSGAYLGALCWACALALVRGLQGSSRSVMGASVGGFAALGLVLMLRAAYLGGSIGVAVDEQTIEWVAGVSILAAAVGQVMVAFGLIMLVAHRHAERLNQLRLQDGLTGVLNRAGLAQLGQRVLARARQARRSVSLVMVDADFFKLVNDTHGHPAGDRVLRHLAAVLTQQVRPGDLVIRYGGEEFVLLLDGSDLEAASAVAQRLRSLIEAAQVPVDGGDIRYRVSIGVTSSDKGGYGLEDLLARADAALYRAKQEGRNRVCIDLEPGASRS